MVKRFESKLPAPDWILSLRLWENVVVVITFKFSVPSIERKALARASPD